MDLNQYLPFSFAPLCKQLLSANDKLERLLALGQMREIICRCSGIQIQIIHEGCIPALITSLEEGEEEEKVLAATILMRCALVGSGEIIKAGGVIPIIAQLKTGSEQTMALAVQTLWLLLLDRSTHESVVCYGGMQLLITIVKKSGVMDAVKDLAAQALYSLWSDEEPDAKKCQCLSSSRYLPSSVPKECSTTISLLLDKLTLCYRKITIKVLNHSKSCASPDTYTLQPALLNVFWLVHHLGDDVIQASSHEFGLEMIAIIWTHNDPLLTGIALDILSLLLKKGMIPSQRANILLSLLPSLSQGDAKIQEKIHYCAQFAPETEIDRVHNELKLARLENLNKEKIFSDQNEIIIDLRRKLLERDVLLNDFVQNQRLAEDLRSLELTNKSEDIDKVNYEKQIAQLEARLEEASSVAKATKKRHKEAKRKAKKVEEKVRLLEKSVEATSNECKTLQDKISKMEQNEKYLQNQLQQSKLIQLQQQKKLQQVFSTTPEKENKATPIKAKDMWSESNMVCPICMEKSKNVSLDECGHTLCKECATMILNTPSKKCPICRKSVRVANPFYL